MESPSFNQHSSNTIADIADRVVQELHIHNFNNDDDVFTFMDENTNTQEDFPNKNDENELDFEFPIISPSSTSSTTSSETLIYEDQISPRFPLFDQSLLQDLDLNSSTKVTKSTTNSSPAPTLEHVLASLRSSRAPEPVLVPISPKPALEPVEASFRQSPVTEPVLAPGKPVLEPKEVLAPARLSLMKLFDEDRNSASASSSDADDLEQISPETYCVWNPSPKSQSQPPLRGKHKKSNSISIGNTSKKWHVRDLLKRSYSDDNYTVNSSPVVLFLPPVSQKPKTKNDKDVKAGEKKAENKIPAYKGKIGNIRLPAYLPYRQDQIAVFNGSSKNMYRY